MIICIDPGHGGYDTGATGNGLREKDVTLKLAL
jgi:N-acetylmuramoyl-L-alanine amidase